MATAKFAIVEKGVVLGISDWDQIKAPDWKPPIGVAVPCTTKETIGDTFDGVNFSKPVPLPPEPLKPTLDQLTTILLNNGTITQKEIDEIVFS